MNPEKFLKDKMALLAFCSRPVPIQKNIVIKQVWHRLDYPSLNTHRKLTDTQVRKIRTCRKKNKEFAKEYEVSEATISRAKKGLFYKDVNY